MSTALAIASVTAVLKDLLNNALIDHDVDASIGEVIVSTLPPDRVDALDQQKKSRLNLFMYQVTPNPGWRNVGLPSRNSNGDRVSNPPLAIDLHYLLTAYGAEELHAEILLGYGMQLLHETPVLTRDAIRRSLTPPSPVVGGGDLPPALTALFSSELAEQVEQIKIAPSALSTEEISRMWAAFQAKYRPTAVYQVSVVLIESKGTTRSALPVRARKVKVIPFKQPIIERIDSRATPADEIVAGQPILAGFQLVLVGSQLSGEVTRVLVGGIEIPSNQISVTDSQVIAPIPVALPAGVQGAQVVHQTLLGSPPTPHRGVESNVAAFVLRPRIETIGISDQQGSGSSLRSANLNLTVKPAIGDTQRVVFLLNQFLPITSPPSGVDAIPDAYSFVAPIRRVLSPPTSPPGPSENITIPIKGVRAGSYLVRIQVDGAESPLETNPAGQYVSPLLTIP
jgi:Pvc16 N-terminal domain